MLTQLLFATTAGAQTTDTARPDSSASGEWVIRASSGAAQAAIRDGAASAFRYSGLVIPLQVSIQYRQNGSSHEFVTALVARTTLDSRLTRRFEVWNVKAAENYAELSWIHAAYRYAHVVDASPDGSTIAAVASAAFDLSFSEYWFNWGFDYSPDIGDTWTGDGHIGLRLGVDATLATHPGLIVGSLDAYIGGFSFRRTVVDANDDHPDWFTWLGRVAHWAWIGEIVSIHAELGYDWPLCDDLLVSPRVHLRYSEDDYVDRSSVAVSGIDIGIAYRF